MIMSTRKEIAKQIRRIALETGMPHASVYKRVYREVEKSHGINLYAAAKWYSNEAVKQNKRKKNYTPMDVAERRKLLPDMLEMLRNMNMHRIPNRESTFERVSAHNNSREAKPAPLFTFIGGEIVDRETGEILSS